MNTSTGGTSNNTSLASFSSSYISNHNHNPMMNLSSSSSSSSSMMFPQFPFPPPIQQQPWFHPHPASVSIQQLLSDHAVNAPSPATTIATSSSPQLFHRMHDLLAGGSAPAHAVPPQLLGGQKSGQGLQQKLLMLPWMYNNDSGLGTEAELGSSGMTVDDEQQQQMLLGLLGLPADQNRQNQGAIDADEQGRNRKIKFKWQKQKRSPVWRYFKQLPAPEKGATCQICQSNIKIKMSYGSTTALYRHLRVLHQKEHASVIEERISNKFKNDMKRQKMLPEQHSKIAVSQNTIGMASTNKFSVEALIEGQQKPKIGGKRQIVEGAPQQQNAEKAMADDEGGEGGGGKSSKRKKTTISDDASDVVKKGVPKISLVRIGNRKWSRKGSKLKPTNAKMTTTKKATKAKTTKSSSNTNKTARPQVEVEEQQHQTEPDIIFLASSTVEPQQHQTEREGTFDRQQRVNDWISVQIGAMVLVDRTEFLLDRVGFRQFIRTLLPQYEMPSTAQFRALILPRVSRQLDTQLAQKFRRNNPFGLPASSPSVDLLQQQQHRGFGMLFPHQQHNPFPNCFPPLISGFGTSLQHNQQQKQHMMANNPFIFSAGPPSFNNPFSLSSPPHQQHNNQQSMTRGNNPLGQSSSCFGGITNTNNSPATTSQPRPDLQPTSSNSTSLSSFNASAGGTAADEDTQPPSSSSSSGGLLDELIKQAFFNSQNISQSFTRSIDL